MELTPGEMEKPPFEGFADTGPPAQPAAASAADASRIERILKPGLRMANIPKAILSNAIFGIGESSAAGWFLRRTRESSGPVFLIWSRSFFRA
jgi:hypothetical protein